MKTFAQLWLIALIGVEIFLFFGGYTLFDISRSFYAAGVAYAFVIALVLYQFVSLSERIRQLEKRIERLEKKREESEE